MFAVGYTDCKIVVFLIIFFRFDPSADQTTFLTLLWLGLIKLLKNKSWERAGNWVSFVLYQTFFVRFLKHFNVRVI